MDFHSVMETFAEAWVAANTHTPLTLAAEQGLINGPTNHSSPINPPNQSPANHNQPVLTVLQEPPKQLETLEVPNGLNHGSMESVKLLQLTHNPDDSSNNCSVGDPKHKTHDIHGKCLPVHCVVEQIPGPQACGQYVELDSYAIVPSDTLFNDLVRTALGKLGYSVTQILGAKGSIQVKKWKALAFDQITENPEATVGDILGDLTTMASLHVRLYSVPDDPHEWKDLTVRNAVLELLREMSQIKLAKICPLSQPMLSNIINNRYAGKIGKEKCQEFGLWYLSYRKEHPEGSVPEVVPSDRPADGRLTFHPSKELPIMRDWFHACRNPSKRTLQMYVDILNQATVRQQERPKIVLSTLKNWWKNEKQRERKIQSSGDDKLSTSPRAKRKRKEPADVDDPPPKPISDSDQPPSFTAGDPMLNSNKFTLINHETDSEQERFSKKDSELLGDHYESPNSVAKPNCNFSLLSHEAELDSHMRHDISIQNHLRLEKESSDHGHSRQGLLKDGSLSIHDTVPSSLSMKDGSLSESPYFQKESVDNHHSLFSFTQLTVPSPKVFCDNGGVRTDSVENNSNSQMSSEEDVDVGI